MSAANVQASMWLYQSVVELVRMQFATKPC
jgi:hypothetical protein